MTRICIPTGIAATVVTGVLLWLTGTGGSTACASIVDAPGVFKAARTLHLKGSMTNYMTDQAGQHAQKTEFDAWIDQEKGQTWSRSTTFADPAQTEPSTIEEKVSAGDCTMVADHTSKTVRFERRTAFERLLDARMSSDLLLRELLGDPRNLGTFARIGQESIDGESCDLWQREMEVQPGTMTLRYKVWLSPRTGRISRVHAWNRTPDSDEPWQPALSFDTIQYDAAPPRDLFRTDPPAGYTVTASKEAAPLRELDMAGGGRLDKLEVDYRIGFRLPDGTILACWRSFDHAVTASQEPLFKPLQPGGTLPKLPIEVYALVPIGPANPATYAGQHLAYTRKDGRFFEWSLYVAAGQADQPPPSLLGYRALCRYNPTDRKVAGQLWTGLQNVIQIDTPEDFARLVPAAMAELADGGAVPAEVTWERVTRLIAKARASSLENKQKQ